MEEIDVDYTIAVKKQSYIISELTDDPKEKLIYESIINGIEETASETVQANKIAQLPAIGCIRKDPVKQVIKDNHSIFKLARKHLTSEEYNKYTKEIVIDARIKQEKEDKRKAYIRRVKSINKVKYDRLYKNLGRSYADMFIYSILCYKEVPYNADVQYAYDKINNLV